VADPAGRAAADGRLTEAAESSGAVGAASTGATGEAAASGARLTDLAASLVQTATDRGVTLGTAESCTGGLVSSAITSVAGASACFAGAVVSYADHVKTALLDVPQVTLDRHGAVSAQVAVAMAVGARARLGCDIAVAVTGVAGPDGGTPAKPVGLAYVAVATAAGQDVRRHVWAGDRGENQRRSAAAALEALIIAVEAGVRP
jgi:PncC family amidohydrolase